MNLNEYKESSRKDSIESKKESTPRERKAYFIGSLSPFFVCWILQDSTLWVMHNIFNVGPIYGVGEYSYTWILMLFPGSLVFYVGFKFFTSPTLNRNRVKRGAWFFIAFGALLGCFPASIHMTLSDPINMILSSYFIVSSGIGGYIFWLICFDHNFL